MTYKQLYSFWTIALVIDKGIECFQIVYFSFLFLIVFVSVKNCLKNIMFVRNQFIFFYGSYFTWVSLILVDLCLTAFYIDFNWQGRFKSGCLIFERNIDLKKRAYSTFYWISQFRNRSVQIVLFVESSF